jgi:hypothetical protein
MDASIKNFGFSMLATGSLFILAGLPSARADDFGNCMQGLARYNSNLSELQNARAQCEARSDRIRADPKLSDDEKEMQLQTKCTILQAVCVKIRPEQGHAACESFLGKGGNDSNHASASQANGILKSLYDECTAQ